MAKKKLNFPQYITTTDRTVSVVGYIDTKDKDKEEKGIFQDNKGYIDDDGNIWIYSGLGKPKNANLYPYFWLNKDSKKEFSKPNELIRNAFNISNLKDMSLVSIIDTTKPNEQLFDEKEINDIISSSAVYVPTIKESDDFLKKLVKYAIIQKGIDINRLKIKAGKPYELSNMKSALNNSTKTSGKYFENWMDLLGCTFDIVLKDAGTDSVDPLKDPIIYESDKNRVSKIDKTGEFIDLNQFKLLEDGSDDDDKE